MPILPWTKIDTVLLDMDGTLLDLHFDNHFWLHHIPAKLAERDGISIEQASQAMHSEYAAVMGTISWYCLDYWAEKLQLDIMQAKREIQHLISLREDTLPFLDALRQSGRRVVLVTNAHPDSLSLKVERTALDQHIDELISTHQFGVTKESQDLWHQLRSHIGFEPETTLFVDDSETILQAAKTFGIGHLLAVANPDSQRPATPSEQFDSIQDYRFLIDQIITQPFRGPGPDSL